MKDSWQSWQGQDSSQLPVLEVHQDAPLRYAMDSEEGIAVIYDWTHT
jgi:hypothetical protein